MKLQFGLLSLALLLLLPSLRANAYYGPFSTEAVLEFDAYVDMATETVPALDSLNQDGSREREKALAVVKKQVSHLIGVFQSDSFKKEYGFVGTLDIDSQEIHFSGVENATEQGRSRLRYSFSGKTIFDRRVFKGSESQVVVPFLKLPRQPDRIYQLSMSADRKNHCTDPYWNDEYDFYYFFDPDQRKCPLKGDTTEVIRTSGVLHKLENTKLTYPQYDRLYANTGDGMLHVTLFYGYINPVKPGHVDARDPAYRNLRRIEGELPKAGFVLDSSRTQDHFQLQEDGSSSAGVAFLHYWVNAAKKVELQILLSDSDSESKDPTFHTFFKNAIESSDIVDYDGHVGTPENLDLHMKALRDVRFDPARYQIFFFNGCSTYPYFKKMYFDAKGGSKNLSLITSGIEEAALTDGDTDFAFLEGFFNRRTPSFQSILKKTEAAVGSTGPYLFGVSGDE